VGADQAILSAVTRQNTKGFRKDIVNNHSSYREAQNRSEKDLYRAVESWRGRDEKEYTLVGPRIALLGNKGGWH